MKLKYRSDGVSPVIATILMVSVTVVLAAVLYVLVIGMPSDSGTAELPIGFVQQSGRNSTTVSLLVASVPNNAPILGSSIYIHHNNTPIQVSASIFYSNGTFFGSYENNTWNVSENTYYSKGMVLQVTADAITHGDKVIVDGYRIGTTTFIID